jgi:hypothetical protein
MSMFFMIELNETSSRDARARVRHIEYDSIAGPGPIGAV